MIGYGKEYKEWFHKALEKGWKTPIDDTTFGPDVWVRYWKACEDYEKNPETGRPVIPHR